MLKIKTKCLGQLKNRNVYFVNHLFLILQGALLEIPIWKTVLLKLHHMLVKTVFASFV